MMIRALWSAATGMQAQQKNIDVIANDLTNASTTGYKKRYVNFNDLFYQSLRASGVQGGQGNLPVGIQVGNGVRIAGTTPVLTTGSALQTDIWSDMMIVDGGTSARNFFRVQLPDGTLAYTRDGTFRTDDQGRLVTSNGYLLDPQPGTIPADATSQTITPEGYIEVTQNGVAARVGQVMLCTFVNPAGLEPMGDNLWKETASSGTATEGAPGSAGFGTIKNNYLEQSNVDAITEMVNMIAAQRSYEFNSKSIQTSDEMLQVVNSLKQ